MASSRHVFIMGAGFSRPAGGPLATDFFNREFRREQQSIIRQENLYELAEQAYKIIKKKRFVGDNIEQILSFINQALLLDEKPPRSEYNGSPSYSKIKKAMVWYICNLVNDCINEEALPAIYHTFADKALTRKDNTFITFNYDFILEELILSKQGAFNYGLKTEFCAKEEYIKENANYLLKLHGSLNWVVCETCASIEVFSIKNAKAAQKRFEKCKKCSAEDNERYGLIVPPASYKSEEIPILSRVWRKAASELQRADKVFIIGYSLPDFDLAARHLIAENLRHKNVEIIDMKKWPHKKKFKSKYNAVMFKEYGRTRNFSFNGFGEFVKKYDKDSN